MASIIVSTTASNATNGHRRIDNIGATLFTRIGNEIFYSSDAGATWVNVRSPAAKDHADIGSVAIDNDPAYSNTNVDAFWWFDTDGSRHYFGLNETTHALSYNWSYQDTDLGSSFVSVDTLAGTTAPHVFASSDGKVELHNYTNRTGTKYFLTGTTSSGNANSSPPEIMTISTTAGANGSSESIRFLNYETSWVEHVRWTGTITGSFTSAVTCSVVASVDYNGMQMRYRVKRGTSWSAYSSTFNLSPDWQGGTFIDGRINYIATLDPGSTDNAVELSVELRYGSGTTDRYVSLWGGYDDEFDLDTYMSFTPTYKTHVLQAAADADTAGEVAVVESGSDAFGIWAKEVSNAWDVMFRKVTGATSEGAGTMQTARTISASSVSQIVDLSVAEFGGVIYIVYTDGSSLYMRSRDAADTTTTNYTVPSLIDGGFKACTVSVSDEGDPIIGVITTNSSNVSVAHYDVSTTNWAGWRTVATTNGVTNSLSSLRQLHTDDIVHFVWTNDQGASKDVRHESINLANISNSLPVASANNRSSFDASEAAEFTWTFTDDDTGDYQTAYQLVIHDNNTAALVHDTGKITSTSQSYSLPSATLTNNTEYYYRVRVWDNKDDVGSYSTEKIFTTSAKPSAVVMEPSLDGETVTNPNPTIEWSYSDPEAGLQSAYRLRLYDAVDNLLWDSGKTAGTNTQLTLAYALANSTDYQVTVEVWDDQDVKSEETLRSFNSSFTPPATPDITVVEDDDHIVINISNQGDATVTANEVWRIENGNITTRISIDTAYNGTYKDYAVKSGIEYNYFVRAIASTDAYADSAISNAASITFLGVWLHVVGNAPNTIHQFLYDGSGRSDDWRAAVQQRFYAGRVNPTFEYGEQEEKQVSASLQLANAGDKEALETLVQAKDVLCYRDSRGRKIFGVIEGISFEDVKWGNEASITIKASNYSEEV